MHNDVKKILLSEAEIQKKVLELGEQITKDYQGKDLLVVGILKGSLFFLADLVRKINLPLKIDFMECSSYEDKTVSKGFITIHHDLKVDIKNKDVLIVEEIIDTGKTLHALVEMLEERGPSSLKIAALLNKVERRKIEIKIDYEGFVVPNEFIVRYGCDFAENYRQLPYVGVLKDELY